MFNTLSDDLLTNTLSYCTIQEMFAMFCIDKDHCDRSQEVLDRRYMCLNINRRNLHRFYLGVQAMIENWRLEKERRISIPMYNNRRRLRTDETPVMRF
jgi:hypothetical protein